MTLPVLEPNTYAKFNACIHCGLCLPACPTYVETLDEADSPRGRIHLMKAAVDGRVGVSDVVFEHLDRCLVCRACETACPSGVDYHDLIESVRPQVARAVLGGERRVRSGMLQWVIDNVLPYPKRMTAVLGPLNLARRVGLEGVVDKWMPGAVDLAAAARRGAGETDLPALTPAVGGRKGSVILLRGCVGSVVSAAVNAAAVRVLVHNGYDVHVLAQEPCCGALAAHSNDPRAAHEFAAGVVEALADWGADYFVSPIAGCSAQLKALDEVLADAPAYAARARLVSGRVRDICELLAEIGVRVPAGASGADGAGGGAGGAAAAAPRPLRTVTYHDPCHLAHAQRITDAPRRLLAMVPWIRLVPLAECDMCCGAAGPYSLNQPEMARRLGERKVRQIVESGAEELITANIGCALQIARHLRVAGRRIRVRHVVEVLAEAYGPGEGAAGESGAPAPVRRTPGDGV